VASFTSPLHLSMNVCVNVVCPLALEARQNMNNTLNSILNFFNHYDIFYLYKYHLKDLTSIVLSNFIQIAVIFSTQSPELR
jgi:hypothetical protein